MQKYLEEEWEDGPPFFSAVPWQWIECVSGEVNPCWHKHNVPYQKDANALQTCDIWIPTKVVGGWGPSPPHVATIPRSEPDSHKLPWIIYIHGGAWRDPQIGASSFDATVQHLLRKPNLSTIIAGIASLNYSLSPYPDHATDPSPLPGEEKPTDPSRAAKHPDHVHDVLTGLEFLQRKAEFGSNYILIGHSCGATLALQAVMDAKKWGFNDHRHLTHKPTVMLGLNGLYDLVALCTNPGTKHEQWLPIYQTFVKEAFGSNEALWREVSPVETGDWATTWPDATKIVLAQSPTDSLVPYDQTADMAHRLQRTVHDPEIVFEVEIEGDHNDIWRDGGTLADTILDLVTELDAKPQE